MNSPQTPLEVLPWQGKRTILHIVGANGSGKSTLGRMLRDRLNAEGEIALLDSEHQAFNLDLDSFLSYQKPDVARQLILDSALALIAGWARSFAKVVIVDRWFESYDILLTEEQLAQIEAAVISAGFQLQRVHLVIGRDAKTDDLESMLARTAHTKAHRSELWRSLGRGTLEERAQEECVLQGQYREFCSRSQFPSFAICTAYQDWPIFEQEILSRMLALKS